MQKRVDPAPETRERAVVRRQAGRRLGGGGFLAPYAPRVRAPGRWSREVTGQTDRVQAGSEPKPLCQQYLPVSDGRAARTKGGGWFFASPSGAHTHPHHRERWRERARESERARLSEGAWGEDGVGSAAQD